MILFPFLPIGSSAHIVSKMKQRDKYSHMESVEAKHVQGDAGKAEQTDNNFDRLEQLSGHLG